MGTAPKSKENSVRGAVGRAEIVAAWKQRGGGNMHYPAVAKSLGVDIRTVKRWALRYQNEKPGRNNYKLFENAPPAQWQTAPRERDTNERSA